MGEIDMLAAFVGCAGVGKNTIIDEIMKMNPDRYSMFPTLTTRAPREGEIEGERYHFVTREDFERRLAEGEIYEHEMIHGDYYYGGSKKVLQKHLATGKTLIKDIDVLGARTYKNKLKDVTRIISVFLYVEDLEILIDRMRRRGDKEEDIAQRRLRFPMEMASSGDSEYMVNNIVIKDTAEAVNCLLMTEVDRSGIYRISSKCAVPTEEEVMSSQDEAAELVYNGKELLIVKGAAAYVRSMREGTFLQKKIRSTTDETLQPADIGFDDWKEFCKC